jgi:hypothetical protein
MGDIPKGSFTAYAADQCLAGPFKIHSLSTQTTVPNTPGRRLIAVGSALALTINAPTPGTDDGLSLSFISSTAFAHSLTCTGHLKDGNGHVNTMTLAAQPAAGFEIVAYNGDWLVVKSNFATGS